MQANHSARVGCSTRGRVLAQVLTFFIALLANFVQAASDTRPNIVVILTDDMGYGDIGAYGATQILTPRIDALAKSGVVFSNGYASANVCTPSRAGLLTGRYPMRSGLGWKVIGARDQRSLPMVEETLAELVKRAGYQTGMVGKWHLGRFPEHLPLKHGFDYFYGVPHSNDMNDFALYDGERKIEQPVQQRSLTRRYTRAATDFITRNAGQPFFLYLAHTFPHIPLFASEDFAGKSNAGVYGDVVEEIDWSTGKILETLETHGLLANTLVVFTSDNGPFFEGSTRGLKGGKGNSWEGGYRVPFVASWPAVIEPAQHSDKLVVGLDLVPTVADFLGILPRADILDGVSLMPLFEDKAEVWERYFYYFNNEAVVGVRDQHWKFLTNSYYTGSIGAFEKFDQLPGFAASYDLLFSAQGVDGESYSLADRHPKVLQQMKVELKKVRREFDSLRTRPPEPTYPE